MKIWEMLLGKVEQCMVMKEDFLEAQNVPHEWGTGYGVGKIEIVNNQSYALYKK